MSRLLGVVLVCCAASLGVVAASAAAAPPNDGFGDAVRIKAGKTYKGTVKGATKQRGEPRHANSLATRSVWYRFRARAKVALELDTCDSNFDTVVAVYRGRSLGSLRAVDFNNDAGCGGGSRVTFTARRGVTYRIAVVGFAANGRFGLRVRSVDTPPNDDFVDAAAITLGTTINATTRNATRELNEPPHADGGPRTVWFKLRVSAPTNVEVSTCQVTVYTGRKVSSLREVAVTRPGGCSKVFSAQPGVAYKLAVDHFGDGGSVRLTTRAVP